MSVRFNLVSDWMSMMSGELQFVGRPIARTEDRFVEMDRPSEDDLQVEPEVPPEGEMVVDEIEQIEDEEQEDVYEID